MPKYLIEFKYTGDGLKGLMKEGGTKRIEVVRQLITSLGGTMEAAYFAYGEADGFFIVDGPDNINIIAGTLMVNAGGGATTKTTVLITPEEVDEAIKRTGSYRPPGQ